MAIQRNLNNPYTTEAVDAYCVIPRFDEFDNDQKKARFTFYFYNQACTKEERTSGSIQPFGSQVFTPEGVTFDTFFADSVLQASSPLHQAYECVKQSSLVEGVETNPWANSLDV